ncbi:MAG TPA: DUF350 domain-containing protein [Spirochaetota bacterium]|nr:DUF350 domain-containing protein [Spirochaetota bacterium]
MPELISQLINLFLFSLVGLLLTFIIFKSSKLLFGLDLSEEIRNGNKAAAILGAGVLLFFGLVVIGLLS